MKKALEAADSKIINYSSYDLPDSMKLLLAKGLNFIPTPSPSKSRRREWGNAVQHVRRVLWKDVFSDIEYAEIERLPDKLKVFKSSSQWDRY